MRLSLRAMVLGVFALLVLASGLQGVFAVTTTLRSAQQLTRLEQRGVVPIVGTAVLSLDLDQQRALLGQDIGHMAPDRVQALEDELASLDTAIARAAPRVLLATTVPAWQGAWRVYRTARASYLRAVQQPADTRRVTLLATRVTNGLTAALDVVHQSTGTQLYQGQQVYTTALETAWTAITHYLHCRNGSHCALYDDQEVYLPWPRAIHQGYRV